VDFVLLAEVKFFPGTTVAFAPDPVIIVPVGIRRGSVPKESVATCPGSLRVVLDESCPLFELGHPPRQLIEARVRQTH